MRIEGEMLVRILTVQAGPIRVLTQGEPECSLCPADAAQVAAAGGFYGVGHYKRIRFLRETTEHGLLRRLAELQAEREKKTARQILWQAAVNSTGKEPARSVATTDCSSAVA